jgi:archaellum component FlaF (FlaF/FlaG flagellin family)
MGFSLVAATAIIGVSIVMAIEIIVGTTIPAITEVHDSFDEMRDRAIEQTQTDITITNAVWSDPNMLISVNNTGSITLNTSKFNILFEGVSKTFTCTVSYHHPEKTATFSVPEQANVGDIITVVTNNGISDYYEV